MGLEHTGVHLRRYGTLTFYFTTSEFAARNAFCCVKLGIELFANLYNIVRQETAFLEPICELSNTSQGLSPYWLYGFTLDAMISPALASYHFDIRHRTLAQPGREDHLGQLGG